MMNFEDNIERSLREEQIRKDVRMECKKKEELELVLEHVWTLFQNLEDIGDRSSSLADDLVASVLFFVSRYELDPDGLPERLAQAVKHHLEESAKESSYDGEGVLMDHLNRALECLDYS